MGVVSGAKLTAEASGASVLFCCLFGKSSTMGSSHPVLCCSQVNFLTQATRTELTIFSLAQGTDAVLVLVDAVPVLVDVGLDYPVVVVARPV